MRQLIERLERLVESTDTDFKEFERRVVRGMYGGLDIGTEYGEEFHSVDVNEASKTIYFFVHHGMDMHGQGRGEYKLTSNEKRKALNDIQKWLKKKGFESSKVSLTKDEIDKEVASPYSAFKGVYPETPKKHTFIVVKQPNS